MRISQNVTVAIAAAVIINIFLYKSNATPSQMAVENEPESNQPAFQEKFIEQNTSRGCRRIFENKIDIIPIYSVEGKVVDLLPINPSDVVCERKLNH